MLYSYNILVFGDEPVKKSVDRLLRYGYDAIELVGEPDRYDWEETRKLIADGGFQAASVCNIYSGEQRDLTSADPEKRENAVKYVTKTISMAEAVGAGTVIIAPTENMRIKRELPSAEDEWAMAVENIRRCAREAEKRGIQLVIEPWNRFETHLVNRLEQAVQLASDVDMPNVAIMGDLFHMNIEEANIPRAIRDAGKWLRHTHIADNQRDLPGKGHLDWPEIIKALKDIGFTGSLVLEYIPPHADPYFAFREKVDDSVYDEHARYAIEFMRDLVERE